MLFDGLCKMRLTTTISLQFVLMLRYIQYIHIAINNWGTLEQIADNFRFQRANGSKIPGHYLCKESVRDMIQSMGGAIIKIGDWTIAAGIYYSLNEDGQTLNRKGARCWFVNVFVDHKVHHVFKAYTATMKSPELSVSELNTIDTGKDATNAMIQFIKSMNRSPVWCSSIAVDGDGTNLGSVNGIKGRVSHIFFTVSATSHCAKYTCTTQIGQYGPYTKVHWDGQHKGNRAAERVTKTGAHKKVVSVISLCREAIFNSQIMRQIWNKILTEHNEKWREIRQNVKHRFGSIVGPIDDALLNWVLIHEFLNAYDAEHRVIDTYKQKQSSYVKQVHIFRTSQQRKQPQKHSGAKPTVPSQEATRLLCSKEPQPPIKPDFVTLYEHIHDETAQFACAIIGDFVDEVNRFGQAIASDNKIYCTELLFVEQCELKLESIGKQTIENPSSARFQRVTSRMKIIRV